MIIGQRDFNRVSLVGVVESLYIVICPKEDIDVPAQKKI